MSSLICTSVDDLRSTLYHVTADELPVLRDSLAECERMGLRSKTTLLRRRIKQLEGQ